MTDSWSIEQSHWIYIDQNEQTTADGQPPEDSRLQCGAACCAMILATLTGVRLPVDTVKDLAASEGYVGPLSREQMQGFLANTCSIPSTNLGPVGLTGPGSLTNLVWQYLVTGRPLCVRQTFSDADPELHFRCVAGLTPTLVVLAEPAGGTRITQDYATFGTRYAGILVGVERKRDSQLP